MTGAEGFLLLTIDSASLSSTSPNYPTIPIGLLSLECVTIPTSENAADPSERDLWLVLRIDPSNQSADLSTSSPDGGLELALLATQHIIHDPSSNIYTLPLTGTGAIYGDATLTIVLPTPSDPILQEDYETLEVILSQYGVLQTVAPPSEPPPTYAAGTPLPLQYDDDLKGKLVLVDDENGQVIGELSENIQVHEDEAMKSPPKGREKDPVVIEMGDEKEGGRTGMFIHPITVDESDFFMRTAGRISKGIVFATNMLSTGMSSATSYYIAHSKPTREPVVFSDTTRKNLRRVHKISGQAVMVTSKATGMIHKMVEKLADRVAARGSSPSSAPPLPPRNRDALSPPYAPPLPPRNRDGLSPPSAPPLPPRNRDALSPSPAPPLPPRNRDGLSPSNLTSPYLGPPSPPSASHTPPPLPPRKLAMLKRILASTDLLHTTIEHSADHLFSNGIQNVSRAMGHKYGPDASQAAMQIGDSARNVSMIYVDIHGVGRHALLKEAGKRIVFGIKQKGMDGRVETVQQEIIFDYGGNPHLTATPTSPSALPQQSYTMPPPDPPPSYTPNYDTGAGCIPGGYAN